MLHNKHVAILSSSTLANLGLRLLLEEYFSAGEVNATTDVTCFLNDSPEKYDLYFISPDFFLLHYEFFLPRKGKSILMTEHGKQNTANTNIEHQLCIRDSVSSLVEQIQVLVEKTCQKQTSDSIEELSPREIEVLQLVARGLINKEIADKLNISINTVLSHRKNITSKLGIKSVSGLSFYAMMNGYISSAEWE